MAVFKCKMCGGTLEINNETVAVCQYCGTKQTLPKLDDDRKANLYDRANHFRRNNEFDKAMGIYEQILNEDSTDAESYWSLVLCRYGIEYVEDPSSRKRIPTINRSQFTSVFDDEDYKSAIKYADDQQKELYENEATVINEIHKRILTISSQEEPFDVFICYKESDTDGRRTPDSVLATELYHELVREGFKVFFSRITLEDKLGQEYEPYIFAALNSAKVMVVLGTKPEYFNAVWVKNEWSRYLALIKNGARKMLIPAYKDMDPYDLPEEFSHLQAQDMSKLGFMQDLIRGIKKVSGTVEEQQPVFKARPVANDNVSAMSDRAFIYLETKEWKKANRLFEETLKINPRLSDAYLGKCMIDLHTDKKDAIVQKGKSVLNNKNFKLALRFADGLEKQKLQNVVTEIQNNIQQEKATVKKRMKATFKICMIVIICFSIVFGGFVGYTNIISPMIQYRQANKLLNEGKYDEAIKKYEELKSYKNSEEQIKEALYEQSKSFIESGKYVEAFKNLEGIKDYKDCNDVYTEARYNYAVKLYNEKNYSECGKYFSQIKDYKDSNTYLQKQEVFWRTKGNVVTLGSYEQDNNSSNGKEKIEWIVLDPEYSNDSVMLISKHCLDYKLYDDYNHCVGLDSDEAYNYTKDLGIGWLDCTLRKWLNSSFYNTAFSSADKNKLNPINIIYSMDEGKQLTDNVSILSAGEAKNLFDDVVQASAGETKYAYQRLTDTYYNGKRNSFDKYSENYVTDYWLRKTERSVMHDTVIAESNIGNASILDDRGEVYVNSAMYSSPVNAVRPIIVVSLN